MRTTFETTGKQKKHDNRVILISIREEYFEQMLNGEKKYEYRTRFLSEGCTAYVYVSKTKKAIVGKIIFGKPQIGTAEEIASFAAEKDACSYNDMYEYFKGKTAYAIPVEKVELLHNEMGLEELKTKFPSFVPPQSYYFLDSKNELLEFVKYNSLENGIDYEKSVSDYFDSVATSYDNNNQKMYWKLCDDILWELIKKDIQMENFEFLDVGGGTGMWTEKILAEYPNSKAVVVDFSHEMLEIARKKLLRFGNRVCFYETDIYKCTLDKRFDVVLNTYFLPFIYNTEEMIHHLSNYVAPGGTLISITENYYSAMFINMLKGGASNVANLLASQEGKISDKMPLLKFSKMRELVNYYCANGLKVMNKVGFPVLTLAGVQENVTDEKNAIWKLLSQDYNLVFEIEMDEIQAHENINRGKYLYISGRMECLE